MSDDLNRRRTAEEMEQDFLDQADDLLEKSASFPTELAASSPDLDVSSRLEERRALPEEEEEEYDDQVGNNTVWRDVPSVRNQIEEYADTIRMVHPVTKCLNLSDKEDLAEYNRIQQEASDIEAPTLAVMHEDLQPYQGSWSVLITYCKVQYMQL